MPRPDEFISLLVVWRTDEDEFLQTHLVRCLTRAEANDTSAEGFVRLAAMQEYGYTDEQAIAAIQLGYEFVLACDMPAQFYGEG